MIRLSVVVGALVVLGLFLAARVRAGDRVALVIGNQSYAGKDELTQPAEDAKAIAKVLARLQFKVERAIDADRDQFTKKLTWLESHTGSPAPEIGLFYFSGHGVAIDGENYLLPIGRTFSGGGQVQREAISVSHIISTLRRSGCRTSLLILDACRNNPYGGAKGASGGLVLPRPDTQSLIAFAADPGEIAIEDPGGTYSLFTGVLLGHLVTPGLQIEEVFKRTRVDVEAKAEKLGKRQSPQEWSKLKGDVVLVPLPTEPPTPVPTPPPPRTPTRRPDRDPPTPVPTPTPTLRTESAGERDEAEMVTIPAGEFLMGLSRSTSTNEKPAHRVWVDAFLIDKYEVTNQRYRAFVDAKGLQAPYGWGDSRFNGPEQPVVGVNWNDAVAFARWEGKRLPTEAEWERAARGGREGGKYPWGDADPSGRACFLPWQDGSIDRSELVGRYAANGFGLHDMAGNVEEWCSDWYGKSYYAASPARNPRGPSSGTARVVRGGSWDDHDDRITCGHRMGHDPEHTGNHKVGFRCARSL